MALPRRLKPWTNSHEHPHALRLPPQPTSSQLHWRLGTTTARATPVRMRDDPAAHQPRQYMRGLQAEVREGAEMTPPCFCGFIYPKSPQNEWNTEECEQVARHQRPHQAEILKGVGIKNPCERKHPFFWYLLASCVAFDVVLIAFLIHVLK